MDENGNETSSNTSGKMVIGSYCTFTMQVVAENVSKTLSVKVVGYDVSRVDLRAQTGNNTLEVGSSVRLLPSYTPIDSIVNQTEFRIGDVAGNLPLYRVVVCLFGENGSGKQNGGNT